MRESVAMVGKEQAGAPGRLGVEVRGEVHRDFRDVAGRRWAVGEVRIPAGEWTTADEESSRAGYGVGWLCFSSGEARRRVRLYPQRWPDLDDTELEQLCRRARRMT